MHTKKIIAAFIFFVIAFSIMQFTVPQIIGFDSYYHIKAASLIKEKGFFKDFPWATHTILFNNYADIQVLFRILLIPFTFFSLTTGAKIASIVFAASALTVFYWFLIKNEIMYPFFYSLVYLFAAESLMYRFLLTREMPIAIALIILTIYFLENKKYLHLAAASFVFALFYAGFIIQLLVIGIYFILERIFSKKYDCKSIAYAITGCLTGLLANPYFPKNISLLYTQISKVNISNLYNVEWSPWPFFEFITNNALIIIFILVKDKKITKSQSLYLLLALLFLAYSFKSRRMQEYFIPFSVLAAAFFLNGYIKKFDNAKFFTYFKAIGIIILAALAVFNFILLRPDIKNNNFFHTYDNCASWMEKNIPKGSLVFNNAYAFPYLFFKNSDLGYTHGIDLTYSYLYNPEEFKRYMAILQGAIKDTIKDNDDWIVKDYNPDYLFIGKIKQDVKLHEYIIRHKQNYKAVYEDEWCAVVKVTANTA
ncbi:hypothetical protein HYX01_00835 [Candidatus Woesearchaeota archaeon]|nr:hypothetical protein [Candidatus Woesearchaeota archaeon]